MRYIVRVSIVVVALAIALLNPIVVVSPSGETYLFWNFVGDVAAIGAICASVVTWRPRIA